MRVSAACNRYRRQCDLLWESQITTFDELLTYKENLQAEYNTLTAQRRELYRKKSKTYPCRLFGANIGAHSPHQRAAAGDYHLC